MKKVLFIKPSLETDAVRDPVRTTRYLGMWYMASLLKTLGHDVRYLDETVRTKGLLKQTLSAREVSNGNSTQTEMGPISYTDFHVQKMKDFDELSPQDFVAKYSAFQDDGTIKRTILRTGNPIEETLQEVQNYAPDIVGIPLIATANYIPATTLAKKIKAMDPTIKVMFGGQHISAQPYEFLRQNPQTDHIITGDAIHALTEILEGKTSQKIIHGGYQNFDSFPLLDLDVIKENEYPVNPLYTYSTDGRKSVDFMFTKGCFRKCDFCVAGGQKGNHVTSNAYQKIDEQLRLFKDEGIQELIIQDDAFLRDKRHVKTHLPHILGLMKKYGLYRQNNGGIDFEGIDDFVTDLFIKYNQTGEGKITSLYIPFNPRTRNKNASASKTMIDRYHENMKNLKRLREEAGIHIFTSAIIGTPEQTKESFNEELATDRALIQEGYLDAALCLSATMLPGTQWYEKNGHNIIDKKDYPGYSLFSTHHRTEHFSAREIEELMVTRTKGLNDIQKVYPWGGAFPNAK